MLLGITNPLSLLLFWFNRRCSSHRYHLFGWLWSFKAYCWP